MPKQVKAEYNNFVKGLISEASPLNFPDNASLDEQNFELHRDGSRSRRLGMSIEPSGIEVTTLYAPYQILDQTPVTFQWTNAGGDQSLVILVVQLFNRLNFHSLSETPVSTNLLGSVILDLLLTNTKYSFDSIDGKLVVGSGSDNIAIITYDDGVFSFEYQRLLTRDLWGVEETTTPAYENDDSYRGVPAIPDQHAYNLQNQSWGIPRRNSAGALVDPVSQYSTDLGVAPSNSEKVWPGLQFQPVAVGQVPFERMYTNMYTDVLGADVVASKGYFVIDLMRRGNSRVQAFADNKIKYSQLAKSSVTLLDDYTPGGPSVVCQFAGRVFYAGFSGEVIFGDKRSPNLSNYVFFSQLVKNQKDFNKCYQEGSPTSRENSDVVDTDGGFVRLSGVDVIIGMVNLFSHLIVIANNGVWAITGGSDFGFTPTNLKVDKLSSFGGISRNSIIEHFGRAFYWGPDGIYVIAKNQYGEFSVNNITETTIQTTYQSIDNISKQNACGIFDSVNKKIRWVYKSGVMFSNTSETKELIFDTVLNSFSINKIFSTLNLDREVVSIIAPIPFEANGSTLDVFVNTSDVDSGGFDVVINDINNTSGNKQPKYLVLISSPGGLSLGYSFSYYYDSTFRDWSLGGPSDGVDAKAYLLTGDQTGGDSSVSKQVPYVTMHFTRTESGISSDDFSPLKQSGCLMRFRWDWSNSINSNKWSSPQQVYRYARPYLPVDISDPYDNGFKLITTKNKIRGRGKAFSMYLETEPLKDCKVVGWNISGFANDKS